MKVWAAHYPGYDSVEFFSQRPTLGAIDFECEGERLGWMGLEGYKALFGPIPTEPVVIHPGAAHALPR